jgi:uncharacterized membrane protein YphA (DoxX/SURF4 family)
LIGKDLKRLFSAHWRAFQAYLTERLCDLEVVADLVQETFLRFAEQGNAATLHGRSYLYLTAQNLAIDHFRYRADLSLHGPEHAGRSDRARGSRAVLSEIKGGVWEGRGRPVQEIPSRTEAVHDVVRPDHRSGHAFAIEGGKVITAEKTTIALGWRVFGLGVMALGMVSLARGDFDPGQPVPKDFPDRTALAYAAAVFMLLAGAAVAWRRTAAWGAAALAAYYALIVVILMDGRVVLAHYAEFGAYSGGAEQLAIAVGGLIVYAANARIDAALAARLTRLGQLAFGVCALLFGGAHFFYMNLTAPLVPKWLPTQEFWAYATGVGHIAAGIAILTGVRARLAAILLTAMFASFTPLVHGPMLLADPSSPMNWTENALNLALIGSAWVVVDSLARPRR